MGPILILRKVVRYFNLSAELHDFDYIHETIVKDSVFKGTNLWILVFAIIVASVGLNMNSTAVIIGAMLISPLMGPINGMGYSIATYNFDLFRQSIKNLSFAVLASLIASTIYFGLSPVSAAHSQLLARTAPSIYDVLIALFGGMAGIVAISSKQKGNVIPGVAIATALMPPLCTAGYGLATGQYYFFFGAFYLFTINTVFIALASIIVSQILKFPIQTLVDTSQKKRVNRWISVVIVLVLVPSLYFGYSLVQREKFTANASKYILNVSSFEGNYLLKSDVNAGTETISLVYGGINLSEQQKELISQKANDFSLHEAKIVIKQGLSFGNIDNRNTEVSRLRDEVNKLNGELAVKSHQVDSIESKGFMGRIILNEIKTLYPQISSCIYAESFEFVSALPTKNRTTLVVFSLDRKNLSSSEKVKINSWLKTRLRSKNIKVVYT